MGLGYVKNNVYAEWLQNRTYMPCVCFSNSANFKKVHLETLNRARQRIANEGVTSNNSFEYTILYLLKNKLHSVFIQRKARFITLFTAVSLFVSLVIS